MVVLTIHGDLSWDPRAPDVPKGGTCTRTPGTDLCGPTVSESLSTTRRSSDGGPLDLVEVSQASAHVLSAAIAHQDDRDGAGFHPDLTGRDNVYLNASILGLTRKQTDRHFDALVEFSGIERFIDTQVKFHSSGMYVRLAFAIAVQVDPDILLVDEVLAVGDELFQRKCLERIHGFHHERRTIVLVTHGLDQVAEFCDRAVVLEHGKVSAEVSHGRP